MPKVVNNNILNGVSGKLGNNIVIRQSRRGIVMANKPKATLVVTPKQLAIRDKFSAASFYARESSKRAEVSDLYKEGITPKHNSVYSVAMSDYLSRPRVVLISTKNYKGAVGNQIQVTATDDFRIMSVSLEIKTASGEIVEQGEATPPTGLHSFWTYTATTANPSLAGSTITVTVTDMPGNEAVETVTV